MPFTQEEAEQKVGKPVRVRDDSFAHERIAKGTSGKVVDAHARFQEVWRVCVQFEFSRDHWLLLPFSKEEYEHALEEL